MRKLHLAKCLENKNWQAIRDDINKNPIQGITGQSSNDQITETLAQQGIKLNIQNTTLNILVEIWGSGKALREFLHVSDMAEASLFVLELDEKAYQANTKPILSHINIGTGKDVTIMEMAEVMKRVVGFKGNLTFDITKPDGPLRKLIDVSRLSNMGWRYSTHLEKGLKETYKWYLSENN